MVAAPFTFRSDPDQLLLLPRIIIYLIAFEVILALISHGYFALPGKIWNMVLGKEDKVEEIAEKMQTESLERPNEDVILSSLRQLLQSNNPPAAVDANARLV